MARSCALASTPLPPQAWPQGVRTHWMSFVMPMGSNTRGRSVSRNEAPVIRSTITESMTVQAVLYWKTVPARWVGGVSK